MTIHSGASLELHCKGMSRSCLLYWRGGMRAVAGWSEHTEQGVRSRNSDRARFKV